MSRSCCSGRQRTKGIQNSLHWLSFTTAHPASSLSRPSCLCSTGLNIKKKPEILSLICSLAEKPQGAAEQCFPSCPLPPRLLCLGWIIQLAFSPPSKVSPLRKSNQDKGLPVLTSYIQEACPQDWDFPILQMALKPWEAAEKRLGRQSVGDGGTGSSAQLLTALGEGGRAAGCSEGWRGTNCPCAASKSGTEALQPLSAPRPSQPPPQHLITPHSILLIRKAEC